ncbi:ABC transporter permease [Mycolicibacterium mucogenicum]|uniref:ABC transporter permease n=1 Tax=Mycolicibacterium mucogenicum TaxID=56689 RepID=A0A1A3H376_MYCMU|nr:ABC transporter permease [Mycolicibacterium mucogenicum]OBJ42490.1 ABC transporter permease [Mycolicibacterium mucogenicum]
MHSELRTESVLHKAWRRTSQLSDVPVRAAGTTGRGLHLATSVFRYTIQDILTFRLPVREFLWQAWVLLKVTATPAVLMAVPIGGIVTVVTSGLVAEVGATALLGAASGVGVLRQGAPVTAGLLMGGAAASAIASDFGARAIREELDAMRVLGVDPVRRLVVPRFLALMTIAPILTLVIIASGTASAFLLSVTVSGVAPGSFWSSFGTFAKMVDVYFAIAKGLVFAAIVAIISSMRGLEARGGPRGVADAVNAAVVINVVLILFANLILTQIQTMFFPTAVA